MRIGPDGQASRGARYVASPNCDARPAGAEISLLVLHSISLPPGESAATRSSGCSPTGSIRRRTLTSVTSRSCACPRISSCGATARWCSSCRCSGAPGTPALRAGAARERCNDFSVGIELEGTERRRASPTHSIGASARWCARSRRACRCAPARRTATWRRAARPIPARTSTGRAFSRALARRR